MKDKYDAIIIGAGIGGLTCGCYLAKAGMKVLILEKNTKAGGYCVSFRRKNFIFDAAVRGLVGCGKKGILRRILDELEIYEKIDLFKSDIFDLIITKDYKISIKSNSEETQANIISNFLKEKKQILNFFELLKEPNFLSVYGRLKNISFQQLLDQFFNSERLKSFWNIMRADTGLPPSKTSALAGLALCRGYILDGGYYPKGGMQKFSDCFVERYKNLGGEIAYSTEIQNIRLNTKNEAEGVVLKSDIFLRSNYIISNSDATTTYFNLIGEKHLNKEFINLLKNMKTSPSAFILYLGLNKSLKNSIERCCSVWYFSRYLKDNEYDFLTKINFDLKSFICAFPSFMDESLAPENSESIYLYAGAPYENEKFWDKNSKLYEDYLLQQLSTLFPGIEKNVAVKESATPLTLYKYTLNRNGASRGWAATINQTENNLIPQESPFKNLYLAGHWITSFAGNGGIAMAAHTGRNAAKLILRDNKKLLTILRRKT